MQAKRSDKLHIGEWERGYTTGWRGAGIETGEFTRSSMAGYERGRADRLRHHAANTQRMHTDSTRRER